MALQEGGLPYALRIMCDGVLETIGEMTFDGELKSRFTAHPKKDPVTGKLYGFGYHVCARSELLRFISYASPHNSRPWNTPQPYTFLQT